jgi:hypothetical protein
MENKLHQISLNFTKGEMETLLRKNGYEKRSESITLNGSFFNSDGEEVDVDCWMKLPEDYEGPRTQGWWESQYKLEAAFEKLFPKLLYNLLYDGNR